MYHQTSDFQHRQRAEDPGGRQAGGDRDFVGRPRAAGGQRVVHPLVGVGQPVKR